MTFSNFVLENLYIIQAESTKRKGKKSSIPSMKYKSINTSYAMQNVSENVRAIYKIFWMNTVSANEN